MRVSGTCTARTCSSPRESIRPRLRLGDEVRIRGLLIFYLVNSFPLQPTGKLVPIEVTQRNGRLFARTSSNFRFQLRTERKTTNERDRRLGQDDSTIAPSPLPSAIAPRHPPSPQTLHPAKPSDRPCPASQPPCLSHAHPPRPLLRDPLPRLPQPPLRPRPRPCPTTRFNNRRGPAWKARETESE